MVSPYYHVMKFFIFAIIVKTISCEKYFDEEHISQRYPHSRYRNTIFEDGKTSSSGNASAANAVDTLQEWLDDTVEGADQIVGVSAFLVGGIGEGITTLTSGKSVLASAWDATTEQGVEAETKIVTDETTIMLASVSKLLTWTALSMMMDAGKFTLDDPINDALSGMSFEVKNPRFPNEAITYRHIFAHTSGIKDSYSGYLYNNNCPNNPMIPYPISLSDSIKEATSGLSKWNNKKPGSKYFYSNYGCALGALLVEQHSGLPFSEFTKKFIFAPLLMTSTQWSRPSDGSAAELYKLYNKKGYKYKTNSGAYCYPDWPSGQLWSTSLDLAKFGRAMLKRGNLGYSTSKGANCLYKETTGDFVYQKISPQTGDGDSALGWFVGPPYYKGGAGHDGLETGVSSDFYVHLESNVAAGFLANGNLNSNQYIKLSEKLIKSAIALGPIENEFDPNFPKDCSTTWAADGAPTVSPDIGTPAPTASPNIGTLAPTASPNKDEPTLSPMNTGDCNESAPHEFVYKLRKGQTAILKPCSWLSKKGNRARKNICMKRVHYQDIYAPPQVVCPITCKSCDACYENKFTKYSHNINMNEKKIYRTCRWLNSRSDKIIRKICRKDNSFGGYPIPSQACPVTCDIMEPCSS